MRTAAAMVGALCLAVAGAAFAEEIPNGELANVAGVARFEGEIRDIKTFTIPGVVSCIGWLTVKVTSYEPCDTWHPYWVAFLRERDNEIKLEYSSEDKALEQLLRDHRRPFGIGVSGPLKVKGTLEFVHVLNLVTGKWTPQVNFGGRARNPDSVVGPKGTWTEPPAPAAE